MSDHEKKAILQRKNMSEHEKAIPYDAVYTSLFPKYIFPNYFFCDFI